MNDPTPSKLLVPTQPASQVADTLTRRRVFAGAGTVGALAAAAAVLPLAKTAAPEAKTVSAASEAGGYQLTEHVLQYYQTARV